MSINFNNLTFTGCIIKKSYEYYLFRGYLNIFNNLFIL